MSFIKKYYKKEVLIIGYGLTGKSITNFLLKQKCSIYIWDDNLDSFSFKENKGIIFFNIKNKKIEDFSFIFVSPGIEKKHFLLIKARKKKYYYNE